MENRYSTILIARVVIYYGSQGLPGPRGLMGPAGLKGSNVCYIFIIPVIN